MSVVALTLPLSGCHQTETKQEVKVVDGWVVNVNIFDGQTEFAFETEGNPTPWSGEIAGRIPNFTKESMSTSGFIGIATAITGGSTKNNSNDLRMIDISRNSSRCKARKVQILRAISFPKTIPTSYQHPSNDEIIKRPIPCPFSGS